MLAWKNVLILWKRDVGEEIEAAIWDVFSKSG